MSRALLRVVGLTFLAISCAVMAQTAQNIVALKAKAESGDAKAQCDLGMKYEMGDGIPQDYPLALIWLRKSADQGNTEAETFLGSMYISGGGVPQDPTQAIFWLKNAAERGDPIAEFTLGSWYIGGHGIPRDDVQAASWTQKAAKQGISEAQYNLGLMCLSGRGVAKDDNEALPWFRKAAAQGNANARQKADALAKMMKYWPLQIVITFSLDIPSPFEMTPQEEIAGMTPIGGASFKGTINGEDHWEFSCQKENPMRESIPCDGLPKDQYRGRWVHDNHLLQLIGGDSDKPIIRFLTVKDNPKNPPVSNDPVLQIAAFDFPVKFPNRKTLKDYPILVQIYGGYSLNLPVAELPEHRNCTAYTWSAYQTSVNCTSFPPTEINRGYVNLDFSAEAVDSGSLHCEAKWRWSHCAMLDPGLYYARVDKDRLVLLTHNQDGKPEEVGFDVELPRNKAQSPVK